MASQIGAKRVAYVSSRGTRRLAGVAAPPAAGDNGAYARAIGATRGDAVAAAANANARGGGLDGGHGADSLRRPAATSAPQLPAALRRGSRRSAARRAAACYCRSPRPRGHWKIWSAATGRRSGGARVTLGAAWTRRGSARGRRPGGRAGRLGRSGARATQRRRCASGACEQQSHTASQLAQLQPTPPARQRVSPVHRQRSGSRSSTRAAAGAIRVRRAAQLVGPLWRGRHGRHGHAGLGGRRVSVTAAGDAAATITFGGVTAAP